MLPKLGTAAAHRFTRAHLRGDVLDGAFVEAHLAISAANHVRVLAHPDALTAVVAPHFRFEAGDQTVACQQRAKLRAAVGVHVPGPVGLVVGGKVFGLGGEAVQAHERGVGTQLAPVGRVAVRADGQKLEQ
jgi:hypothetical protein